MYNYKNRDEVPEKYKWNLNDFFKSEEDFLENLEEAAKQVEDLKKYKNCTKDANKVYEYLQKEIDTFSLCLNLEVYSFLKDDEFLGVKENVERKSKALDLMNKFEINTSFFNPELLSLSKEEYDGLFISCKNLKELKPKLDKIYRKKEHILPENEENIISELTNAMNNFLDISSNMLNREHDYGKVKLPDGTTEIITVNNLSKLLRNKDRNIRKKAYNSFNKKLSEYAGTSANLLNSYVKANNTYAKLHKFKNAWESKLFNWQLNDKVFKSLVSAVEENASSMTRYYSLKKKILNLKKIYPYDLNVSLTDFNKEYTIEEAQDLIKKALSPLGEDYIKKLTKIFDSCYIDYCGYKGKCSGGYSMETLTNNSRILMSYNADLNSISTVAHECGHNVHGQYLKEFNTYHYNKQPVLVDEVASLTNECLFSSYISKNGETKEEKLSGIENIIRVIASNLFGAVREGKMEEIMYEEINNNGTVTKELLNKLSTESIERFYGNVVSHEGTIKNDWITRTHYYYNFYLYSYSISISVASHVANEILKGNKDMLNKYIKFLSTGSDVSPSETFKILGVDLEDKEVYNSAIKYFDELINLYEKIYYNEEVSGNE